MTVQPFSRVTSSRNEINTAPDASLPPHMEHLRRKRRDRPTDRQRARKALAVGEARRNGTVALVRSLDTPTRKRGGAKYGPPPKNLPHERMQAPKPMGAVERTQAYTGGTGAGRLTARQERQINRMVLRNADRHAATDLIQAALSAKGRPTPKRGAR